jgi:excisionase family DNA binding protein
MKTPPNKTPSVKPTYVRAPEAAKYICVSVSKIYRMLAAKKLKSYLVGGTRLFKVADLDALVEAGEDKQEGG